MPAWSDGTKRQNNVPGGSRASFFGPVKRVRTPARHPEAEQSFPPRRGARAPGGPCFGAAPRPPPHPSPVPALSETLAPQAPAPPLRAATPPLLSVTPPLPAPPRPPRRWAPRGAGRCGTRGTGRFPWGRGGGGGGGENPREEPGPGGGSGQQREGVGEVSPTVWERAVLVPAPERETGGCFPEGYEIRI